jgi:5-methylthioadenosine/S-adenosylhomocysteine deaminase
MDMMQPHLLPVHDVISNIVYCGTGRDVVTTIVDGRILMEDRRVLAFDERKVMGEAMERADQVKARWARKQQSR